MFDGFTEHQVLIIITELCSKVKHFRCEFNELNANVFKNFMIKFRTSLKFIRISTSNDPKKFMQYLESNDYQWKWTLKGYNFNV